MLNVYQTHSKTTQYFRQSNSLIIMSEVVQITRVIVCVCVYICVCGGEGDKENYSWNHFNEKILHARNRKTWKVNRQKGGVWSKLYTVTWHWIPNWDCNVMGNEERNQLHFYSGNPLKINRHKKIEYWDFAFNILYVKSL